LSLYISARSSESIFDTTIVTNGQTIYRRRGYSICGALKYPSRNPCVL